RGAGRGYARAHAEPGVPVAVTGGGYRPPKQAHRLGRRLPTLRPASAPARVKARACQQRTVLAEAWSQAGRPLHRGRAHPSRRAESGRRFIAAGGHRLRRETGVSSPRLAAPSEAPAPGIRQLPLSAGPYLWREALSARLP